MVMPSLFSPIDEEIPGTSRHQKHANFQKILFIRFWLREIHCVPLRDTTGKFLIGLFQAG